MTMTEDATPQTDIERFEEFQKYLDNADPRYDLDPEVAIRFLEDIFQNECEEKPMEYIHESDLSDLLGEIACTISMKNMCNYSDTFDKLLNYSEKIRDDTWRVSTLAPIARGMKTMGDERADEILDKAISVADRMKDNIQRVVAFLLIVNTAKHWEKAKHEAIIGRTYREIRYLDDDEVKLHALATVGGIMAERGIGDSVAVLIEAIDAAMRIELDDDGINERYLRSKIIYIIKSLELTEPKLTRDQMIIVDKFNNWVSALSQHDKEDEI